MKVKTWIPLALAVVLGLAALKLTRDAMSRGRGPAAGAGLVPMVVAAHDVAPGQMLTPADLTLGKAAPDSLPAGAFQTVEQLADRVVLSGMVKGQPVLENALAPAGTAAGVQALIPPGMRAITLQVTEFSGLAGLLVPGSKVDVISVIRKDDKEGSVARTIVQNVEVRAVGRRITAAAPAAPADPNAAANGGQPEAPANNVTLLVTPEQAEKVQLASAGGQPWLVLRNTKDGESVDSAGVTVADLRGGKGKGDGDEHEAPTRVATVEAPQQPAKPADAQKPTRTVKFIRATKEEAVQVEMAPPPPEDWQTTGLETGPATTK